METTMTFTAKTAEAAIEEGLKEMNLTADKAEIEIIDAGKVRLIGKSTPAVVQITRIMTDGERAVAFLEGLFSQLGEEVVPVLESEEEKIVITLQAENAKNLIGRRGENIDAIQSLAGAVANKGRKAYKRVVVDHEDYRARREETLKRVAQKLADKAVRYGKRMRLEPMNPYERRIIHSALIDNAEVTTRSEGSEPNRFVVITPVNMRNDRNDRDRNRSRGHGKDKRGERGEKKPYPGRTLPAEGTPESSGTSFRREGADMGFKRSNLAFFGTYLGNSRDDEATDGAPSEIPTDEE